MNSKPEILIYMGWLREYDGLFTMLGPIMAEDLPELAKRCKFRVFGMSVIFS